MVAVAVAIVNVVDIADVGANPDTETCVIDNGTVGSGVNTT